MQLFNVCVPFFFYKQLISVYVSRAPLTFLSISRDFLIHVLSFATSLLSIYRLRPSVFKCLCVCRVSLLSCGELLLLPLLWFISLKTLCDVSIFAYGQRERERERESKRSIRGSSTKTATLMTTILRNTVHWLTNFQSNRVNREDFFFMMLFQLATVLHVRKTTLCRLLRHCICTTGFGTTQKHTSKHQIFTQRLQPIDYKRFVPGVYLQTARLLHTSGHFKP